MTLGLPPSMMATQELVVPRSMPMIFAMLVFPVQESVFSCMESKGIAVEFKGDRAPACAGGTSALARFRDHHQGGAQHAVVEQVALLQHRHDGARLPVA